MDRISKNLEWFEGENDSYHVTIIVLVTLEKNELL